MKKIIYLALTAAVIAGCTTVVHKKWSVVGGSKADATVRLAFEYAELEEPVTDELEAKNLAVQRCKAWGYKGANAFDSAMTSCVYGPGVWSNCGRYRVTMEYQCTE